ncbi:hypothetical protein Poli38472_011808 [Pythium oligandrum]|uniref:Uncharacterized protein n=1 Tax=Pythium oligandrum TaxID=41045 RepID=A0A8K1C8H4_PYTOL|nr:hypothetical protein Poli38472_011808 [Pythium oligandrum]|eukprot:TMW58220.1 hypothetical protein Poli38472_011808 [Pythium oligandrum]
MTTLSTTSTTSVFQRNVRCLLVGEDLDVTMGCFSLPIDEYQSVEELQQEVLRHVPSTAQDRLTPGVQLFKGFDLYYQKNKVMDRGLEPQDTSAGTTEPNWMITPTKPKRGAGTTDVDVTISDLLKTITPEKVATKYFQRKYAMRRRDSVHSYLARGHKCDQSRIDVLVSVPKIQFSEDLADTNEDDEYEGVEHALDFDSMSEAETESSEMTESPRKRRRQDPVLKEADQIKQASPSKWQRAPCGRVVSVESLRVRCPCKRCLE